MTLLEPFVCGAGTDTEHSDKGPHGLEPLAVTDRLHLSTEARAQHLLLQRKLLFSQLDGLGRFNQITWIMDPSPRFLAFCPPGFFENLTKRKEKNSMLPSKNSTSSLSKKIMTMPLSNLLG